MEITYIAPQFPKLRHGFELSELRELAKTCNLVVITLRGCSEKERRWLDSCWPDRQVPIVSMRQIIFDCAKRPKNWSVLFSMRGIRLCFALAAGVLRRDIRAFPKVAVSLIGGIAVACYLGKNHKSLIHADFISAPGTVAMVASAFANMPFSMCGHAFDVFSTVPAGAASQYVIKFKVERASVVFAENSKALNVLAASAGPIHKKKVLLKRNAASIAHTGETLSHKREQVRRFVGLGGLVEKKGFDLFIRAIAKLNQSIDGKVVGEIWGEGEERANLLRLINGLNAPVTLKGAYTPADLHSIFAGAVAAVLPSRELQNGDSDGVPTVLIEAATLGVPLIGADVGSVRDLIRPGVTGWLVPEGDVDRLERAMTECLNGPSKAAAYAQAARAIVETEFSVSRSAATMIEAWGRYE